MTPPEVEERGLPPPLTSSEEEMSDFLTPAAAQRIPWDLPAVERRREEHYRNHAHPQKLNNKHHLLACALVSGMSQKEAAASLGFHPQRVTQVVGSELFQHHMQRLRDQLAARVVEEQADRLTKVQAAENLLDESLGEAASVLASGMHSKDEKVKQRAARDILDRRGLTPVEKSVQRIDVVIDTEQVDTLRDVLAKMRGDGVTLEQLPD